jgi:hypothetical protein
MIPLAAFKIRCAHCHRPTHPDEMVHTPALAWACLRCLEDARPGVEAR